LEGGALRAYFSSKYKTLLIWGTKKLYWRRVLGGLGGFI